MNTLVLVEDGGELEYLQSVLMRCPITGLRTAGAWDGLLRAIEQQRPDVVLLSASSMARRSPDLPFRAGNLLASRGLGTVVWLPPGLEALAEYFPSGAAVELVQGELDPAGLTEALVQGIVRAGGEASGPGVGGSSGGGAASSNPAASSVSSRPGSSVPTASVPVSAASSPPPAGASRPVSTSMPTSGTSPVSTGSVTTASGDAPVQVVPVFAGDLSRASIGEVLIGMWAHRLTGVLRVAHDRLERFVGIRNGEPFSLRTANGVADAARLLSMFVWHSGTYSFQPSRDPAGLGVSLGSPLELVLRGVQQGTSANDAATAIGRQMRRYPCRTRIGVDHIATIPSSTGFPAFLDRVAAGETLERGLMQFGADMESALRFAYFASISGMLVFRDAPTTEVVGVTFVPDSMDVPHLAASTRASSAPQEVASGRPPPPVGASGEEIRRVLTELQGRLQALAEPLPYAAFGLEPGCGRGAVTRRFYELVREGHPDVYASLDSAEIRTLASQAFVKLKSAYDALSANEQQNSGAYATVAGGGSRPGSSFVTSQAQSGPTSAGRSHVTSSPSRSMPTSSAPTGAGASGASNSPRPGGGSHPGSQSSSPTSSRPGGASASVATSGTYRTMRMNAVPPRPGAPAPAPTQSPETLFRTGLKALEQGSPQKGIELLNQARARGLDTFEFRAQYEYARYLTQEAKADDAVKALMGMTTPTTSNPDTALCNLLIGHIRRMEGDNRTAANYYQRAARADDKNPEVLRWSRATMKKETDASRSGESFFGKLFQNRVKK